MERRKLILVFDASAIIADAKQEPGASVANALLTDASATRRAHAVNLCEVLYHFLRAGDERGERALTVMAEIGVETRDDLDPPFWRSVADLKVGFPHASLGDCFAIALARRVGGTIVTADHPGFGPVASRGVCPVTFIR